MGSYRCFYLHNVGWTLLLLSTGMTTDAFVGVASSHQPPTIQQPRFRRRQPLASASTEEEATAEQLKDFRGEAAGIFGNVRIPAALFAGASAGAAFALPVAATTSEGVRIGLVKRLYELMMMTSLSSEVVAVVVSTLVLSRLSTSLNVPKATSLQAFLQSHLELEFLAVRWHFLSGVLFFLLATGLRAWISIACPIVAKAALGIILSSATLCVAFVQDAETTMLDGIVQLPFKFLSRLSRRIHNPLFALAFVGSIVSTVYILYNIPHFVHYLSRVPMQ